MSAPDREQLKIELQQVNQQISQQTRGMEVCLKCRLNLWLKTNNSLRFSNINMCTQAASNSMLLQREACALASQPTAGVKWSSGGTVSSEQLSLELHHVEREIGKRTREIAMVSQTDTVSETINLWYQLWENVLRLFFIEVFILIRTVWVHWTCFHDWRRTRWPMSTSWRRLKMGSLTIKPSWRSSL